MYKVAEKYIVRSIEREKKSAKTLRTIDLVYSSFKIVKLYDSIKFSNVFDFSHIFLNVLYSFIRIRVFGARRV